MQRVLSGERARCVESSEEFVTKKLCISFIIVCAFFSVLGGFFLGRYAIYKVAASKKTIVEYKYELEILNELAVSIHRINNLTMSLSVLPTSTLKTFNYKELYSKLRCKDQKPNVYVEFDSFKNNVSLTCNDKIMTDLTSLKLCYGNITSFLESVLFPGVITNTLHFRVREHNVDTFVKFAKKNRYVIEI